MELFIRIYAYVTLVLLFLFTASIWNYCRALERKLELLSTKVDCLCMVKGKGEKE